MAASGRRDFKTGLGPPSPPPPPQKHARRLVPSTPPHNAVAVSSRGAVHGSSDPAVNATSTHGVQRCRRRHPTHGNPPRPPGAHPHPPRPHAKLTRPAQRPDFAVSSPVLSFPMQCPRLERSKPREPDPRGTKTALAEEGLGEHRHRGRSRCPRAGARGRREARGGDRRRGQCRRRRGLRRLGRRRCLGRAQMEFRTSKGRDGVNGSSTCRRCRGGQARGASRWESATGVAECVVPIRVRVRPTSFARAVTWWHASGMRRAPNRSHLSEPELA